MRFLYSTVLLLVLNSCRQNDSFKQYEFPENNYQNFSRKVVMSESWIAYPDGNQVLFFKSLDFHQAIDSILIEDSLWYYAVELHNKSLEDKGLPRANYQKPSEYIAERFGLISIDALSIYHDSLLFCALKIQCIEPNTNEPGSSLRALYPMICYNLNTKKLMPELTVVSTSIKTDTVGYIHLGFPLNIVQIDNEFHFLAYGTNYNHDRTELRHNNEIHLRSFKNDIDRLLIKTESLANILNYSPKTQELQLAMKNTVYRYAKENRLVETIETSLSDSVIVYDLLTTGTSTYFLAYKPEPELFVQIYQKGKQLPLLSIPYESASSRFLKWQGKHYFFYDEETITKAFEFK